MNKIYRYHTIVLITIIGSIFAYGENAPVVTDPVIDSIQYAITQTPNNSKLYFDLGSYCKAKGDYVDALQAFNKALELKSEDYAIEYKIADIYYLMDSFIIAQNKFEDLVRTNHATNYAYANLINIYFILDERDKIKTLIPNIKKNIDLNYGWVYALLGDNKNAIDTYKQYIKDGYGYNIDLALLYNKTGDKINEKRAYDNGLKYLTKYYLNQDRLLLKRDAAIYSYRLGKFKEATEIINSLISLKQENEHDLYNFGVFKIAAGDTAGIYEIQKAISRDSTGFMSMMYYAIQAIRRDSLDKAIDLLSNKNISSFTNSGIANGLLAYCLEKRGEQLLANKHWLLCYCLTPLGTDIESIRNYIVGFIDILKSKR
jgi:tetratricopeptide (TPR) repeat protein